MSVADTKPSFQTFIEPIVDKLKDLERIFEVEDNDKTINTFRCFLLYGVYDKPARAMANQTVNSNGYWGCCKCLQKGERLKNKQGE